MKALNAKIRRSLRARWARRGAPISLVSIRVLLQPLVTPLNTRSAATGHFGASLAMAGFLGAASALALLPGSALINKLHLDRLSPGARGQPVATASLAPADSLIEALSPTIADELAEVEVLPETRTITMKAGDTLAALLTDAGASPVEAHTAMLAMRPLFDPRKVRAGQEIQLTLAPLSAVNAQNTSDEFATEPGRLLAIRLQAEPTRFVEIKRDEQGNFLAEAFEKTLTVTPYRAAATIDSSLFLAADDAQVPQQVIVELIRLFSYDIDFQREIQKGDTFEVLFTRKIDEDGKVLQEGDILYAAINTSGKTHKLYRFTAPDDGSIDYYDEKGQSAKKFLMRTPIDGARLSSGFGMRRHPVLGYTKMHKGTDFAAPRGTPIMAAGAGTVEFAGRNGTYGNYIRLRHGNNYKTAYAHMSGFARGIRKGAHIIQGQTIGYVGTTGRSTGPHLHYEVLVAGNQVNPMSVRVPTGRTLEGQALAAFQGAREGIETQFASATVLGRTTTASLPVVSATIQR